MNQFNKEDAETLSKAVFAAFESTNQQIANIAQVIVSTTKAIQTGQALPVTTQPVLDRLAESMTAAVAMRKAYGKAVGHMGLILVESNLDVFDFGCHSGSPICPEKADSGKERIRAVA